MRFFLLSCFCFVPFKSSEFFVEHDSFFFCKVSFFSFCYTIIVFRHSLHTLQKGFNFLIAS